MKRHVFALGILSQALQYGAALIVLPFILLYLSPEEVGLWFVFSALLALTMLVDFGFQATFARNFALAYSGVSHLCGEGIVESKKQQKNYELISAILQSARVMYLIISILVFILLITIGTIYIKSIINESAGMEFDELKFAWYGFVFSVSFNIYFLWLSPFFIGSDNVHKNYIYIIISKMSFSLMSILFLVLGFGLNGIVLSLLISLFVARIFAVYLYRGELDFLSKYSPKYNKVYSILKVMWPNTSRIGIVSVASFLINRYNLLLVTSFFGLGVVASYGLTLQVLTALGAAGKLLFQTNLPRMIKARVQQNKKLLKSIYLKSSGYFFAISIFGILIIGFYGNELLVLLGSKVLLLDRHLFLVLASILLLEGNHSNAALVITTGNSVPFVLAAVISGFSVAFLSTAIVISGYGLLYIMLAQGVVQLAYNNWKWPVYLMQELR